MEPLLQVENLSKVFTDKVSLFNTKHVDAVQQISFSLEKKKTLAITGKNGSGKSTLAKMIVGITKPSSGRILFKGKELTFGDYQYRAKHIRMIFQDPNASFNPRLNIGQILDAPLQLSTNLDEQARNEKIFSTLRLVGFYPDHANIPINMMSISQKQRIALARAIILEPDVIILDNVLGNLDISVKTQLINLLLKLQERLGISYIYLGQNLGIIKHVSDQLLVMDNGLMVEYGETQTLLNHPQTELTQRMVESYFG